MSGRRVGRLALIVVLGLAGPFSAQQPRDSQRATSSGSGAIVGTVVDDHEGRPLRRAVIRLNGSELESARTTITDDDGSFAFADLPAGRYSVHASKAGYVSMNFAASAPGRPGRSIQLRGGQRTAITVRLPRGSVITGFVRAPNGEPAPGLTVHVLESRFDPNLGERRFSIVDEHRAVTDDRGSYRIFGLPAGRYLVAALPRATPGRLADLHVLTQSEIRAALAEVAATRTTARPGMPAPLPSRDVEAATRSAVNLTPVFFPGTTMQERAAAITLGAAEVRSDVNFDLEYVSLATVSGSVTAPPGMRVIVQMANADRTAANQSVRVASPQGDEGRFSFPRIPPGAYAITALAVSAGTRSGATPAEAGLWGETHITVAGDDIDGIPLTLQQPLAIGGRVMFESDTEDAPALELMRIPFNAVSLTSSSGARLPSVVFDGSRFGISGVVPGVYRLATPPRGIRTPIGRWWLKSVVINNREVLDAELELRESSDSAVITFSDRASALSGVVSETDGRAADGFVVVFSTDRRHWFYQSRRIAGAGISSEGGYVVRNLPAGDYHVAVSRDLFVNEWFDPERLERLAASASTIRIQPDEIRTLDLRAAR